MSVYVRRPDTPETSKIGENWSKLVETDQFQPVSPKNWYQFFDQFRPKLVTSFRNLDLSPHL